MPVTVTYPGVYVQEIPSGVHTITGVATSIAAFIGWAPQGPTDQAAMVLSWQDYVNQFGGLDARSNLGYAVNQFFNNGGQQAYIVRLIDRTSGSTTAAVPARSAVSNGITFLARNEGEWGNDYDVRVTPTPQPADAARFRLDVIYRPAATTVESFTNLSPSAADYRYVLSVVESESLILAVDPASAPTAPSAVVTVPLGDGRDGNVLKPGLLYPDDPNAPGSAGFGTLADFTAALLASSPLPSPRDFLSKVDIFNLLCVPGLTNKETLSDLEKFCQDHRAFLVVDSVVNANPDSDFDGVMAQVNDQGGAGVTNAGLYFPWVNAPDALDQGRIRPFPPCGFVAGLYAATDASRGVWKAPAGVNAGLTGASGLRVKLTDAENGVLNPLAVNCLRNFPVYGNVVWGARTLSGNDQIGSEWKYVPVRRTALFIEESLYRGTKWAVFEPNDEPLWSQLRLNVGVFMQDLFRQGAFQGQTAKDAYFVKCDSQTTTQNDINKGIVNILVGFAPLKPAEFVVIQIQQIAGQIQV